MRITTTAGRRPAAVITLALLVFAGAGCGAVQDRQIAAVDPACATGEPESLVVDEPMGQVIEGSDFSGRYIIGLLEALRVRTKDLGLTSPETTPASATVAVRYRILNRTPYPLAPHTVNRLLHVTDGEMSWPERPRASMLMSERMGGVAPHQLIEPNVSADTWVAYDVPADRAPCSLIFADGYGDARRLLGLPARRSGHAALSVPATTPISDSAR